jgi:hypothetical protein
MKRILIILLFTACNVPQQKVAVFKKGESPSINPNKPSFYEGYLKNDTIYLKRIK